MFLSRAFDAYKHYPPLDIPTHFIGGVAIAFFFSRCFAAVDRALVAPRIRPILEAILVITLTATASVFWEFAEYVYDWLFGTHAQVDLEDTLLDMLLGIAGGVFWVLVAMLRGRLGAVDPLEPGVDSRQKTGYQP